jgi:hypothetical protein
VLNTESRRERLPHWPGSHRSPTPLCFKERNIHPAQDSSSHDHCGDRGAYELRYLFFGNLPLGSEVARGAMCILVTWLPAGFGPGLYLIDSKAVTGGSAWNEST